MFPTGDFCQQSLDALAARGLSRMNLPGTLQRLVRAGFLSAEQRRVLMQQWADFLTREPAQVVPLRVAG
jgi:hypothetical protein